MGGSVATARSFGTIPIDLREGVTRYTPIRGITAVAGPVV